MSNPNVWIWHANVAIKYASSDYSLTQVWEWINMPLPAILRFTRAQGCGSMPISFIIGECILLMKSLFLIMPNSWWNNMLKTICGLLYNRTIGINNAMVLFNCQTSMFHAKSGCMSSEFPWLLSTGQNQPVGTWFQAVRLLTWPSVQKPF